mmetsp:Transcript_6464/g.9025  ORF Transcript_6464/g.9025 Transcript_6464/m.9025 type:complete len:281 (-) Transcript_6464:16-858(-)
MPAQGDFSVRLIVGEGADSQSLPEVTDTTTGMVYAISRAGDEYKVRMTGPGDKHVGAILQIDGHPKRQDFRKSPFTYFKKPYDDPGFWSDPANGKFKARVFGCPQQVGDDDASAAVATDIGVIRVFFFDVHRRGEEVDAPPRQYVTPETTKIKEGKKWYMASTNTRYASEKKLQKRGCKFQITDRSKPLAVIELRYKDETSLKLLGWDGESSSFAFSLPWQREKQARSASEDIDDDTKGSKRPRIEYIDLTEEHEDDPENDDVVETEPPPKPKPNPIVLE